MVVQGLPIDGIEDVRSLNVAPNFSMRAVDGLRGDAPTDRNKEGHNQAFLTKSDPPPLLLQNISNHPDDDPILGTVLSKFVGTFRKDVNSATRRHDSMVADNAIEGAGMSTIFRPNFNFTNPLEDNLLEVNLTVETLQFMQSSILAKVPNRGFDNQDFVELTGIPYMQTVSDKLNEPKGDRSNKEVGIHFEQGLLMRTPPTVSPNTNGKATISRLGSIPHGTTINLQDWEPQKSTSGPPNIPKIDITPFDIIDPNAKPPQQKKLRPIFDNMKTMDAVSAKVRKPPNLAEFAKNKTMSLAQLQNPNQFLIDFFGNDSDKNKKTVIEHFKFTVKSKHDEMGGGGVANISFLVDGNSKKGRGNAIASTVECTYWVSTVKYKVLIDAKDYSSGEDPTFKPTDDVDGVPGPRFQVQIRKKTTQPNTIEITAPIIQYSQNVTLDFGTLSWPHVSVATLAPALPILIPQGHDALKNLK